MGAATFDTALAGKTIASSALEAFVETLAPLNAFSTSFDSEAGQINEKIVIPYITKFGSSGASQAAAFVHGTDAYSDTTTTGATQATIELNQHKFLSWELNDIQAAENAIAQLETFGYQKGRDIATTVFQDILGEIVNAKFANKVTVAASDFDVDDVVDLRKTMVSLGGDISQCSLVLSPDYYAGLLTDQRFQANESTGDVIKSGSTGSVVGIPNVYESSAIPSNSENLVGFLAHPSALGVAFRYLQPTSTQPYTNASRLGNDEGMTMGYRQFYLPEKGIEYASIEALYGKVKINDQAIVRIVSSS